VIFIMGWRTTCPLKIGVTSNILHAAAFSFFLAIETEAKNKTALLAPRQIQPPHEPVC